jgi:two-component system, OmpR family, sensor histidine kinase MprB
MTDLQSRFRYRRSLASRVILLTTFVVGLSVALMAVAAYFTVRHQLQSSLDTSLYGRASLFAQAPVSRESLREIPAIMQAATDTAFGYVGDEGASAVTPGPGGDTLRFGPPEVAVARGERRFSCRTIVTAARDYRVAAMPSRTSDGVAVVVAQSLESNERTLGKLGLLRALFGAAGVVAAGLAGWVVARNGLRPVRTLTDAAEEIARTEQLDPIEVEGNDEIARLARAFNTMLTALAASRDRQRQLVADAGHELRTPLTSLRTNLELLTQADRQGGLSEASRTELLDDVRFQIEELTNLIGDLTELAREQPAQVLLERVDLVDVLERAVQRVRRRASSLDFDLRADPWWVTGEAAALERAVTNLLDNAAKWSPPQGVVTVTLSDGKVTVTDQGAGIAEEDLPHVFDRFYRSPDARPLPGSGLGLSIVRQVAERHGGLVRVGHAPGGGAQFEMFVPGTPGPPRAAEAVEHSADTARS